MFRVPDDITTRAHSHTTPMGRVWVFESDTLGLSGRVPSYVVRRLGADVPMLKIGAVLGMASSLEAPNMAPATHWLKRPDGVWTATPLPIEAQPLSQASPPRLSWGEAVELWRPLAHALQTVHGRGLVHGHLTPWSVWWDSAARRLIALDAGAWIADLLPPDSSWWTGGMIDPPARRRPSVKNDIAALARLLLYLHLPDGEADVPRPNFEGVPAYAIPAMERALLGEVPGVKELIAGTSLPPLHGVPSRVSDAQASTVLFGRVNSVEPVENERLGRGIRFWISYPEYDAHGQQMGHAAPQGAFFYEGAHGEVFESVRHVWEGAELNLIDARVVEDSQGRSFLTARPETLPVLEPHWPVSVSSVIKADGCVNRFFVDVRDSGSSSKALVFGNLVHGILEDLTDSEEELDFELVLHERLADARLAFIGAGLSDRDLPGIAADARAHYDAILGFARARGDRARVGWTGDLAEVSRYSSIYGLEGRIDLVTQDERDGVQIVELKTGSQRSEHVGQVRCYKLLWDGVVEERSTPVSGYLLYSKEAQLVATPLDDPLKERSLLRARNALVAAHHDIATYGRAEIPYFMQVPRACNAPECRWRKSRCKAQTRLLGLDPNAAYDAWPDVEPELVDASRVYWRHLSRLVELENWVENSALGEILQSGRVREREQAFRAVSGLTLIAVDAAGTTLTFEGGAARLGVGERIIAHRGDFHRSPILRGTIVEASARHVKVKARGAASAADLPRNAWILDVMPARIGYRSAHQSIFRVLESRRADLLEVLLRPGSAASERLMTGNRAALISDEANEALNDAQLEALATSVSSPLGALIQGPPGTGKTTVIAHLVRELVNAGKRVILSAQTNTAVDTMLEKICEVSPELRFLRVGRSSRSRRLTRVLEDAGVDVSTRFSEDLSASLDSLDAIAASVESAPIIGCTTHAAARSDVITILSARNPRPFDVAIVDEATQITEPMSLAPLNLANRFVLVGDHRQLPPIVQNEEANSLHIDGWTTPLLDSQGKEATDQLGLFGAAASVPQPTMSMGLKGLDRSLFERLVDEGIPYVMLTTQYRMHADIMSFPSGAFYGGQLEAHPSVAESVLEVDLDAAGSVAPVLAPAAPVVFSHVETESDGRTNEAEAQAVCDTIQALLSASPGATTIGVVSPFRAQVQRIRDLLVERDLPDGNVTVDTVERYQGSERDIILVSLVKTERTGEFLSDARRLNVTLTRARKKLIIFGHRGCLELDPLFRRLIEHPKTHSIPWPDTPDMPDTPAP